MTPIDIYVLSLFIADLIHDIGVVLGVRWLTQGEVFWNILPSTSILEKKTSIIFSTVVVGVMWLYVILFVSIAAGIHSKPDNLLYTHPIHLIAIGAWLALSSLLRGSRGNMARSG
ncbi:hypothetical protein BU17DRAFT_67017 [Hysterangium stoloniferum]|nr:hypothetical protein BU17DRAFT_67017 [Hysterangium stoloniferum]